MGTMGRRMLSLRRSADVLGAVVNQWGRLPIGSAGPPQRSEGLAMQYCQRHANDRQPPQIGTSSRFWEALPWSSHYNAARNLTQHLDYLRLPRCLTWLAPAQHNQLTSPCAIW